MSNDCSNFYKTCRKVAGFTQEQAIELLGVEVRRLSDYENGAKVPDDVVDKMADAYNAPLLAIWHLKTNSPLGKYLPEIFPTQTDADLGLQTVFANKNAARAEEHIMAALEDGQLTAEDLPLIEAYIKYNDATTGSMLSGMAYVTKVRNQLMKAAAGT